MFDLHCFFTDGSSHAGLKFLQFETGAAVVATRSHVLHVRGHNNWYSSRSQSAIWSQISSFLLKQVTTSLLQVLHVFWQELATDFSVVHFETSMGHAG